MAFDLFISALVAAIAAAVFAPVMIAAGVMDAPDRLRKIHAVPNPTSGGVAIGFGFAAGVAVLAFWGGAGWDGGLDRDGVRHLALGAVFAASALALGLWDDLRPLGPRGKGALQLGLSLGVALFVARADALPIVGDTALRLNFLFAVAGSTAWVFVLMNSTNFMDGANGLAMGSSAISLSALGLIAALSHANAAALLAFAGAGALIGFLVWNWPHGKLFAGDSGALFAGMLAALTALVAVTEGGISPFVMPILFFPVLADALLTLLWRIGRKRMVFDGHREHFYQIGIRAGLKPAHVTIWYWLATLGCAAAGVAAAVVQEAVPPGDGAIAGAIGALASLAPKLVLAALIAMAVWVSIQVRRFSAARAIDGE
jgi:UDP-GlcNAc:undecaprenyl-phosphate GlcNAc-1-phosphate transferase